MQNPRTFWMSVVSICFMLAIIVLSAYSMSNLKEKDDQDSQRARASMGWTIVLAVGGILLSALIMWYAWEGSAGAMAARAKAVARATRAGWSGALQSMRKEE